MQSQVISVEIRHGNAYQAQHYALQHYARSQSKCNIIPLNKCEITILNLTSIDPAQEDSHGQLETFGHGTKVSIPFLSDIPSQR